MSALPPKADIVPRGESRHDGCMSDGVCTSDCIELADQACEYVWKAGGPSGRAKIHSDDPKHALGLAQYLRSIGYSAWLEDTNGNEIDEKALKMAISSRHADAHSS